MGGTDQKEEQTEGIGYRNSAKRTRGTGRVKSQHRWAQSKRMSQSRARANRFQEREPIDFKQYSPCSHRYQQANEVNDESLDESCRGQHVLRSAVILRVTHCVQLKLRIELGCLNLPA